MIFHKLIISSSGSEEYWLLTVTGSGAFNTITSGSDNTIVAAGNYLFATDKNGTVTKQYSFYSTKPAADICVSDGGNFFAVGDDFVTKFASNATYSTTNGVYSAGTINFAYGVDTDSLNNVYVVGTTDGVSFLSKYNSSLSITSVFIYGSLPNHGWYDVTIDSSDNIYTCGYSNETAGYVASIVAKYTTSGSLVWEKALGGGVSENLVAYKITTDSSGNVYVCGKYGTNYGFIAKYNSSGSLQWQRYTTSFLCYGITCDSHGNVYVSGYNSSSGYFLKINSSGTLVYGRSITKSATTIRLLGISVDPAGSIILSGISGSAGIIVMVPSNGALTGTYDGYVYASAGSLSISSLPDSTPSTSTSAGSTAVAGGSIMTMSALSSTKTSIG